MVFSSLASKRASKVTPVAKRGLALPQGKSEEYGLGAKRKKLLLDDDLNTPVDGKTSNLRFYC